MFEIDEKIEESYDDYVAEKLKDSEYKKEWMALREEYEQEVARLRAEIMAEEAHQPMMHRRAKRAQMAG